MTPKSLLAPTASAIDHAAALTALAHSAKVMSRKPCSMSNAELVTVAHTRDGVSRASSSTRLTTSRSPTGPHCVPTAGSAGVFRAAAAVPPLAAVVVVVVVMVVIVA